MSRSLSSRRFRVVIMIAAVASALPSSHAEAQTVGTAGAVNPSTTGVRGGTVRNINLGSEVVFRERVTTSRSGSVQVTFIDKSTLNVGPSSEVVIDEFVFNPQTGVGQAAITLGRGALRFVGGQVSKAGNVEIRTPAATIGIRGGVAVVSHTQEQGTRVVNVFGRTTISTAGGVQVITRPGFAATVAGSSAPPSAPTRVAQADLDNTTRSTTSQVGQTGGRSGQVNDRQTVAAGIEATNAGIRPRTTVPVQSSNASRAQNLTTLNAQTPGSDLTSSLIASTQGFTQNASQTVATDVIQQRNARPRAFALTLAPSPGSGTNIPFLLGSFAVAGNAVITPVLGYRVGGTNNSGDRTRFLQAALVIDGQGINQRSTIVGTSGDYFFNEGEAARGNPQYTFAGGFTAVSRRNANSVPARATGSVTSVPGTIQTDADQLPVSFNASPNQYVRSNGSIIADTARQTGGAVTGQDYSYNVGAVATNVPSGLGEARASQTLVGFMAGILRTQNWTTVADFNAADVTGNFLGTPYQVSSNNLAVTLEADRSTARADANLTVQDPQQTTLRSVQVRLGRNPNDSSAAARSAFVDSDFWLVRGRTSVVAGTNDQQDVTTITTTNASNAQVYTGNRQLLVPWSVFEKQDQAGSRASFPTVTQWKTYQHTQWGFWSAQFDNLTGSGGIDRHAGQLNTWVAGLPTDPAMLPRAGTASFGGHAIATINNFTGGQNYIYVAGGNFNGTVNFGSQTSAIAITNLDGRNLAGSGSFSSNANFGSGSLTGTGGLSGSYEKRLYGPGGTEAGGQFGFTGTNYRGSGIFIGQR